MNKIVHFLWKYFPEYLDTFEKRKFVIIPILLGFLLAAIRITLLKEISPSGLGDLLLTCVILFLWGLSGLFIIYYKEFPTLFGRMTGWLAIFNGLAIMIIAWGIALIFIVNYFKGSFTR